jgi:hypothetical protein
VLETCTFSDQASGMSVCFGVVRTRAIRRESSHFEYLDKRSRGLDVTGQPEETLLWIREQSLSCGASQSAVRRRWLNLCVVWPSHSKISSLSKAIWALGKARSLREPNMGYRGLTDLGDVMLCQKSPHDCCRMGRRIVVMKLICSLGYRECSVPLHYIYYSVLERYFAKWALLLVGVATTWSVPLQEFIHLKCLNFCLRFMPYTKLLLLASYKICLVWN